MKTYTLPNQIVITGATGWMGRSTIWKLIDIFGIEVLGSIYLYGSTKRILELSPQIKLTVRPIEEMLTLQHAPQLFIPLAFATRDRVDKFSTNRYESINLRIIQLTKNFIRASNPSAVISLSSGIVSSPSKIQGQDQSYLIYRNLKIAEEEALQMASSDVGASLVQCRLFSSSGEDMTEPLKYAMGDIVNSANSGNSISIKSRHLVRRRYVDSRSLMELLITLSMDSYTLLFESGGEEIEIRNLARLAVSVLDSASVINCMDIDEGSPEDEYASTSFLMEQLMVDLEIYNPSLSEQIINTQKGLSRSSFKSSSRKFR